MKLGHGARLIAAATLTALLLAGCSTFGDDSSNIAANDQPQQLSPVDDGGSVSSDSLPPLNGSNSQVASTDQLPPPPTNQPDYGTTGALPPPVSRGPSGAPGATASAGGRDFTGGVTVQRLLGGWTVMSGTTQCRLNLTNSAADPSSGHYRASAPGCSVVALGSVAAWQLAGNQIQLFDNSGTLIGALLLAGNRFLGTLSGGQAISMAS